MNPNKRVIIVSGARTIRARAHRGTGFGAFKRCYLGFRFKQREIAKKGTSFASMCHKETTIQTDDGVLFPTLKI